MEINQKENELHLYSINENEHIGAINATTSGADTYRTIIFLDASLAVKNVAARFVKEILPLVISKVKNWHPSVNLITFGEVGEYAYLAKSALSILDLECGKAANFGLGIEKLRVFLESCLAGSKDLFDLLVISAREISDRENAEQETKKLNDFLATRGWRINSQAVRLFTPSSEHQPDTKALSYLLQINNSTAANICDVNVVSTSSNETIANEIAALFPENTFRYTVLNVDKSISLRYPWKSFQWNLFIMTSGWNIFWLKQLPTRDAVKLQDQRLNVVVEGQLTLAKFQQLMEKKLPQIISHLTILKIVGTAEANETVDQIFSYFAKTEDALAVKCSTPNNKIVTNALADIAMFKPDFRTSAEMIEFHRNPTKAMKDRKDQERRKQEEAERLKKEEEERLMKEEEELQKQEEAERLKKEDEERLKKEEEERLMKEEEELQKQEEAERLKKEDEERLKKEEEDRLKQKDEERLKEEEEELIKQKEAERLKQEEAELSARAERLNPGDTEHEKDEEVRRQMEEEKSLKRKEEERNRQEEEERLMREEQVARVNNINPNNNRNSVQTVFILCEHSSQAHIDRRFTEEIVPLMLAKFFHESWQLVHLVTFLRHKTTTAQTIQSLVQTLDATKRIRISVVTNGEVHEQQEVENFAEAVIEFLGRAGYTFELQVVRLASPTPTTSGYKFKLVDIDANTSNELTAKQIA